VTSLVFPVGHYLGPYHHPATDSAPDGQPAGHRVRVGPSLRWLGTEPELLAWTFAHGLHELVDDDPWTRGTLIEYAWQLADADLTDAVARLLERRLLVEVDPDGQEASGFGRSYRLRTLMLALGRDPGEPGAVLLGTAGEPVVALSEFGYAVWQASQRSTTLWGTCASVAQADPAVADAGALLPELLAELHGLLGAGVAYLDTAEGEGRDAAVAIH
jgi:hypothetical protein